MLVVAGSMGGERGKTGKSSAAQGRRFKLDSFQVRGGGVGPGD